MKTVNLCVVFLAGFLLGCNKSTPAGFWKGFDKDDLVINNADQGPWGGYRAMYWKRSRGKFMAGDIVKYAADNGWKLIDTKVIEPAVVNDWLSANTPIFPIDKDSLHISVNKSNRAFANFHRWITGKCNLYEFDSGWVVIDPGTSKSKTAIGYVLLSDDHTQMSVYHLWGE